MILSIALLGAGYGVMRFASMGFTSELARLELEETLETKSRFLVTSPTLAGSLNSTSSLTADKLGDPSFTLF